LDLPFAQRYAKVLTLWRMLEAVEADRPVKQSDAVAEAMALARKWEAKGVIVTIERVSNQEPAMGNHHPVVRAWAKRSKEPK
jgi:hypothetical protein